MRLVTVILCVFLTTSLAVAQITITSSDMQAMYASGKSWRMLNAQSLSVSMNVGSASSSAQSWIVPTVTYSDTMRMDNLLPSATPYASRYPRATHAQRQIYSYSGQTSTYYNYIRITADSVINLGGVSRMQGVGLDTTYYDTKATLTLLLPLTLGRTITTRDSIPFYAGIPGPYIIDRSTTSYDAFGSLTVPGGTFQALRSKEVSISETYYPAGLPTTRDTSTTYSWITREGYMVSPTTKDRNPGSGTIPINTITYLYIAAGSTGLAEQALTLPTDYHLYQNYPNPFNPTTSISFSLPVSGYVTLKVFDALGQEVATLVSGIRSAGTHTARWSGEGYPSGIYFYRMIAAGRMLVGKMSLVK